MALPFGLIWAVINCIYTKYKSRKTRSQLPGAAPTDRTDVITDIYERLANARPEEKREIVIGLIGSPPTRRLILPRRDDGVCADLSGADLSGLILSTVDRQADLRGINLEKVDLSDAQLSFAQMQGANLARATLKNAILEDAHLEAATLTEADLQKAFLRGVHLEAAFLESTNFQSAKLPYAHLKGARLIQANLQESDLRWGHFEGAILDGSDLRGADFLYTHLEQANLQDTKLQGVNLSRAFLTYIYIRGARLEETQFHKEQLGGKIGEELIGHYRWAMDGYRILKQNFEALGDYSAASWAYVKEKQMEKEANVFWRARRFYGQDELTDKLIGKLDGTIHREGISNWHWKTLWFHIRHTCKWLSSLVIEGLCGYGENPWLVLLWIALLLFVCGPASVGWRGQLKWEGDTYDTYFSITNSCKLWGYMYLQHILYMVDTFTTASFTELKPANDLTRAISGCYAIFGIFLIGLLGFVAGNKIRHS